MNELINITNNAPAIIPPSYSDDDTGMGDMRLKPSTVSLVQATSRAEGGIVGKLRDELSGAHYDSLTIVPLKILKGRVMFPKGGDLSLPPICKSDDGAFPSKYIDSPQASKCGTCPNSQWVNNQRPPCDETARIIAVVRPTTDEGDPSYNLSGLPIVLNIRGLSMVTYREFLENVNRDITRIKTQEMAKPTGAPIPKLFDYIVTVKPIQKPTKFGTKWMYTFVNVVRAKTIGEFGPFHKQYVVEYNKASAQARAEQVADNSVGEVLEAELIEA